MAGDQGGDNGDTALPGLPVGHSYRRFEVLGTGAMGTVYRAEDRQGNELAVKMLRAELTTDPVVLARFIQERALLIRLASPNIVRVVDLVVEGDTMAIVMEKVDGGSLSQYLKRLGDRLETTEAVHVCIDILEALSVAHAQGVVHRDIKPDNVLIDDTTEALRAKVTDFGISGLIDGSAHTRLTSLVGTPEYMAPELVESVQATSAVDIYSVGIVLYELIAGKTPFAGGSVLAILKRHAEQIPERPDGLGDELWSTLMAMMAKDPAHRPSAQQAQQGLEAILESHSQTLLRQPSFLDPHPTADPSPTSDNCAEMIDSVPDWQAGSAIGLGAGVAAGAAVAGRPSFDSPGIDVPLIDAAPSATAREAVIEAPGDTPDEARDEARDDSDEVFIDSQDVEVSSVVDEAGDDPYAIDSATIEKVPHKQSGLVPSEVGGIAQSTAAEDEAAEDSSQLVEDPSEIDDAAVQRPPRRTIDQEPAEGVDPADLVDAIEELQPAAVVDDDAETVPPETIAPEIAVASAVAAAGPVTEGTGSDFFPSDGGRPDPPPTASEDAAADTPVTESSLHDSVDIGPSSVDTTSDVATGEDPPDAADLPSSVPPSEVVHEDPNKDRPMLGPSSADEGAEGSTGGPPLNEGEIALPLLAAEADWLEPSDSDPSAADLSSDADDVLVPAAVEDALPSDPADSTSDQAGTASGATESERPDPGLVANGRIAAPVVTVDDHVAVELPDDEPDEIDESTIMRPEGAPAASPKRDAPRSGRTNRRLVVAGAVGLIVVVAIVLAAVLLTGSKSAAAAATVDGVTIPESQFNSDLAAIKSSPTYQCYLNAQAYEQTNGESFLPNPSAPDFAAFLLQTEIGHQMVKTLAASKHIAVTPQQIDAARQELSSQITGVMSNSASNSAPRRDTCGSQTANPGGSILASLPSSYVHEQEEFVATDTDLQLTESGIGDRSTDLERYYSAHRSLFDLDCYTAAAYPSLAEAQTAYAQIQAGSSFSQVAFNGESGPQTCAIGSTIDAGLPASVDFASLTLNQVSQPFQNKSKYDLLQLKSQKANSFTTVQTQVTDAVQSLGQGSTQSALAALEHRAKVWVNPSYGTWQSQNAIVLPPRVGTDTTSTGG